MARNIGYKILFLVILVFSLPVQAQEQPGDCNKHFLWKVGSDSNTLYLLGSVHLLSEGDHPMSPAYEKALEDSQVAVFEIDLGEMDKPETTMMVLSKSTIVEGKVLSDILSPETYDMTAERLKELGMNIALFNKSKPWFVATTLTVMKLRSLGFNPEYGIDRYLYEKAKKEGKDIESLETVEEQIDVLSDTGSSNEDDLMLQTLEDLDVVEEDYRKMLSAWKCGDPEQLEKTIFKSFEGYPGLYKKLIVDRNNKWLPAIERYLSRERNHIIVVGSGHLIGKDGLVKFLREKGYTIEQL